MRTMTQELAELELSMRDELTQAEAVLAEQQTIIAARFVAYRRKICDIAAALRASSEAAHTQDSDVPLQEESDD